LSRAFELGLVFVLSPDVEGGYSNDPDDPGGETKFGISKRSYPNLDIARLTRAGAEEIYRRDFWDKCRCDELALPIALALFDSAVNQGPRKAIRLLQQALKVSDDGVIGDETIGAAAGAVPREVLIQFLSRRAIEYARGNPKYQRGWFVRLFRLQAAILGLA
jgi:lysozyme family protein